MSWIEDMAAADMGDVTKAVMGMITAVWFFVVLASVLILVSTWRMFRKAGRPGWACLIPVYGTYVSYSIVYDGTFMKPVMTVFLVLDVLVAAGFPLYLPYVMFGEGPGYAMTMAILSFIMLGVVLSVKYRTDLARSFGRGFFFGLGLVFLPFVFTVILGFNGRISYCGPCGRWKRDGRMEIDYEGTRHDVPKGPVSREEALEELRRRKAAREAGQAGGSVGSFETSRKPAAGKDGNPFEIGGLSGINRK